MFIIGLINNPVTGSQPNWQICEFVSPCTREQELLWIQDKMWKIQYVGVLSSLLSMCSVSDLDYFVNKEWNENKKKTSSAGLFLDFPFLHGYFGYLPLYHCLSSNSEPASPARGNTQKKHKMVQFCEELQKRHLHVSITLLKNTYFLIGSPIFGVPIEGTL